MILTVDIGNTRIKWAQWHAGTIVNRSAAVYEVDKCVSAFDVLFSTVEKPSRVLVVCVAGEEMRVCLSAYVKRRWKLDVENLKTERKYKNILHAYEDPRHHGVDRWAALLGARKLYATPVCVLDVGTAVTVDLMDAGGVHRGGRIMPGLNMMRNSLLQNTVGVKEIEGDCPGFAISTADAVTSGTLHMLQAGLLEVCESAEKRLGKDMQVILTGGMAEKMLPLLDQVEGIHLEPHLVLYGLYYASQQ